MIFSCEQSWRRVSLSSSFEGWIRSFFLFPLINPSRWGLKGPLRNKIFFPTREKEIIMVLLIHADRPCRHIVLPGFWTSCGGLKGPQSGKQLYNLGVGKTAKAEIKEINKFVYIKVLHLGVGSQGGVKWRQLYLYNNKKILTFIHQIQCNKWIGQRKWGNFVTYTQAKAHYL